MFLEKNVIQKQENLFMNKKIIIFGDSYAAPPEKNVENPNVIAWYKFLESDYEIINTDISGTGPHYSFKKYYNFINNDNIKKEDCIIIFVLSGEYRIHFPSTRPGDKSCNWDVDKKESWWCEGEGEEEEKAKKHYEFFKSEIDFLFLTMYDELNWSNFKNLGFLYMNSLLLNMKTIVFYTFGIKPLNRMSSFFDISKLNNLNFYLYPVELGRISNEEFIDLEEGGYDYVDNRKNHLLQENHTILYENIKKFIKNDYNPIPFAKNIGYSSDFVEIRDTKTGKYIYE
jgi:hypothetical protein